MKTEIITILDKSGSMHGVVDDTIGGFNSFIKEQREKEENEEVNVTLTLFDTKISKVYVSEDIDTVAELTTKTYSPGGMTALFDAVGLTIQELESKWDKDPDKVIVVIITDGQENSSVEYTYKGIKRLINRKEKEGFEFIFLGAGMEAFNEGKQFFKDSSFYDTKKKGYMKKMFVDGSTKVRQKRKSILRVF